MSFQIPITIAEAIRNVEQNRYLLPAIQREFEWKHEKIEWLFDSIMQNYPISSFLFWRVEGKTRTEYKFYQFLREYRQNYKTHNEEYDANGISDFTAVLDGQQRLTSLFIGLRGSYAYKTPKLHDENTERVYPTRRLYLNVEKALSDEEDGRKYEFKFLTNAEYEARLNSWFPVSKIYDLSDDFDFNKYLDDHNLKANEFSYRCLSTLKNVVHSKPIINFFLEKEQSLDKALNIFIRINSGGEPLSFSAILMSIAVANWVKKDARKEIHALVDNAKDKGIEISKDFVLKTFLCLHSKDIKFKVANFSNVNAKEFENEWEKIRDTILSTLDLVKSFGFSDITLTSRNALIPIVYYLYHKGIYKDFHTRVEHSTDREIIKKWLHIALVKRLFGGTSDNILSQIRKAFTDDVSVAAIQFDIGNFFPVARINDQIKKDMGISDEFIDDLLYTQKDDKYAFSILALLYPNLDYRNNNFHKDHLHPEASFDELSEYNKKTYGWNAYNSILNLQMLDANENMSKQNLSLVSWVDDQATEENRAAFLAHHLIPQVSLSLSDFDAFILARKILLSASLKNAFS